MKKVIALALLLSACIGAIATPVGEVSTGFNLIAPNNKIIVDVFDDPAVAGVSCCLSHAQTGGFTGAVGLAEDTSDASVAWCQVVPVSQPLPMR